jgi:hypothetical protein
VIQNKSISMVAAESLWLMKAQWLTWYEDLEEDVTGECPEVAHLI